MKKRDVREFSFDVLIGESLVPIFFKESSWCRGWGSVYNGGAPARMKSAWRNSHGSELNSIERNSYSDDTPLSLTFYLFQCCKVTHWSWHFRSLTTWSIDRTSCNHRPIGFLRKISLSILIILSSSLLFSIKYPTFLIHACFVIFSTFTFFLLILLNIALFSDYFIIF